MKLSEYLVAANLKPAEFAALLRVTSETVRLWLKGSQRPSNPQYDAILAVTGGKVTPNDFMRTSDAPSASTAPSESDPSIALTSTGAVNNKNAA